MAQNRFDMKPMPKKRTKYVLLALLLPIGIIALFMILTEIGMIPASQTFTNIVIYGSMILMSLMSYAMVINHNHTIEVRGSTVTEKGPNGKEKRKFQAKQISKIRRNAMGEMILLDQSGEKLLCMETSMSNYDLFLQWMESHNIEIK